MSSNTDLKFVESLESEDFELPKRWKNDDESFGEVERHLEDWPKYQAYYESLGVPCYRVADDGEGNIKRQTSRLNSLQLKSYEPLKHEHKVEFVTMARDVIDEIDKTKVDDDKVDEPRVDEAQADEVNVGQKPSQQGKGEIIRSLVGGSLRETEFEVVTMTEPLDDFQEKLRRLPKPQDVFDHDNPAADAKKFLSKGIELVQIWSDGKWSPGDLFGPNGSDPETKAQSATYAPSSQWNQITEPRLATSSGHIVSFERPPDVCLGWGGYEEFDDWQSAGRRIRPEMVEAKKYSVVRMQPVRVYSEGSKEVGEIVHPSLQSQDLLERPRLPETLHQLTHKRAAARKREQEKKVKEKQIGLDWDGPDRNAEK